MSTYYDSLTPEQQALATLCDMHKDAYGFKPVGATYDDMSLDEMSAEMDRLSGIILEQLEEEKKLQAESVVKFEQTITDLCAANSIDRTTAIRWLRQAENDEHAERDDGYFEFLYNLPYGYLSGKLDPMRQL